MIKVFNFLSCFNQLNKNKQSDVCDDDGYDFGL